MKGYHKRILLSSVLMMIIAVLFWTGSRYPQLNEKALLGAQTESMGISFDTPSTIQYGDSYIEQIFSHTINWIDTNKKGMTFGLLFGSILMVLFSLLKEYKSENPWINTVIGVLIGAPLGVCVNCAAPIAMGMKDAGARTETALATMISSPTLNVIVISMLFSLLPPYMVWLKLGSTMILLLLVIPVLCKFLKTKEGHSYLLKEKKTLNFFQPPQIALQVETMENSSWYDALIWTLKGFFIGLWYLIRTAVPLMLLAGLLGNILITFLPLEGLLHIVGTSSFLKSVLFMTGIALVGAFLPVPMAFDVLITAVLWSGGLQAKYAMTLLFTLGSFSIYSAFIIDRSFSRKLAISLFGAVCFIGMANGTLGHFLEKKLSINYLLEHYDMFLESNEKPTHYEFKANDTTTISSTKLNELVNKKTDASGILWNIDNVQISGVSFKDKSNGSDNWFSPIEGPEIGIDVPYQFSPLHCTDILGNQRSMSAGDVHGDGYPDLLIASANNLFLYANLNGESFQRQSIMIPDSLKIHSGALVDLDNDGWLDIFFSTYRGGNYIKFSKQGNFDGNDLLKLPQTDNLVLSASIAFGDVNTDGLLDIILGNWTLGVLGASNYSVPASKNFWLENMGEQRFEMHLSTAPPGETLSTLLSDFTGDEAQDLLVGNDFLMPDYFYTGNHSKGIFDLIENPRNLLEKTTKTTMSITTVDINNDLEFEIYEAQTDQRNLDYRTVDINKICGGIKNNEQRNYCEVTFTKQQTYQNTLKHKKFEHCENEDLMGCIAFQLIKSQARINMSGDSKDYFTQDWGDYHFISNYEIHENRHANQYLQTAADTKRSGGILLKKNKSGRFMDQTDKYGIRVTGWAWNSKFADLDNDQWQDLFVANGFLLLPTQESNMFYKNINGSTFKDQTVASGLLNYLPSSSNSYIDFDLDGDLDIALATSIGPIYLYKNNNHKGESIRFKLEDELANHFGIGSKITIFYGDEKHQMRELLASGGYKSYDQPVAHFGLGEHTEVTKVIVKWSTGEETIIASPLESGSLYTIKRMTK